MPAPVFASVVTDLGAASLLLISGLGVFAAVGLRQPARVALAAVGLGWVGPEALHAALERCSLSGVRTGLFVAGMLCVYTALGLALKAWEGLVDWISVSLS